MAEGIKVGDAVIAFVGDMKDVDKALASVKGKAQRAGKEGGRAFGSMGDALRKIRVVALSVGAAFAAWKVAQFIRDAARASLDFERAFANVTTLIKTKSPEAQAQVRGIRNELLNLSPQLGSATELTRGLYQALSAGVEPAQAVRFVGEAAEFAKAALTDTFTAVDVMTTILNAYGKEAEEAGAVSSVLFKTIEQGKTTGEELAGALGRVIPVAAALNVELPEVSAALATLTKSGLSTNESVTALRAILKTMLSPETAERFDELGISQEKMRAIIAKDGLNAALQELDKVLKDDTAATANLFREQEAQVGIFTLLGAGAGEYEAILEELNAAQAEGTATTDAFNKQQETLGAQLDTLKNAIERQVLKAFVRLKPALRAVLGLFKETGDEGSLFARIMQDGVVPVVIFFTRILLLMTVGFRNLQIAILKANEAWARLRGLVFDTTEETEDYARAAEELAVKNNETITTLNKLLESYDKMPEKIEATGAATTDLVDDLDDVDDAAGDAADALAELGKKFGFVSIQSLKEQVETADAFAAALGRAKAPAFEINQALKARGEALRALKEAQAAVLGQFGEYPEKVDTATERLEGFGLVIPDLVSKVWQTAAAMDELGLKSGEQLRERLAEGLEALRTLKEAGIAAPAEILAAEIAVAERRIELQRIIGEEVQQVQIDHLEELRAKLAEIRGEIDAQRTAGEIWGDAWEKILDRIGVGAKKNLSTIAVQALEDLTGAFQQSIVAAILGGESIGKAMKKAAAGVLAGIAAQAIVLALFELAAAFASLAVFDFRGAALHFKASAIYGAVGAAAGVAAKVLAPKGQQVGTLVGSRGEPGGVLVGPETAAPPPGPITVTRAQGFAEGGIVTRPTLATLGERGPEAVVPLTRREAAAASTPAEDAAIGGGGRTTIFQIEGLISQDRLEDLMDAISERVEANDGVLLASDALSVTRRG